MHTARIMQLCGRRTFRPTNAFRRIVLPVPHRFLTVPLQGLRRSTIRLEGRATLICTSGLAKSIVAVWPPHGRRVGLIQSVLPFRLPCSDISRSFLHELLTALLQWLGRLTVWLGGRAMISQTNSLVNNAPAVRLLRWCRDSLTRSTQTICLSRRVIPRPIPHKFLTSPLQGLGQLTVWFWDRFMVSRTDGLANHVAV